GLWNRFVPSLDGYIQDRLNNPVHVPKHGTVKTLRLEAPSPSLVRRVVEARLRPCLEELPEGETDSDIAPFVDEQVTRIAGTEPTLRDMLQQFRHLFDHVIYGPEDGQVEVQNRIAAEMVDAGRGVPDDEPQPEVQNRIAEEQEEITFKSVEIVELGEPGASATGVLAPFDAPPEPAMPVIPRPSALSHESLVELWQQEQRTARRKLEP